MKGPTFIPLYDYIMMATCQEIEGYPTRQDASLSLRVIICCLINYGDRISRGRKDGERVSMLELTRRLPIGYRSVKTYANILQARQKSIVAWVAKHDQQHAKWLDLALGKFFRRRGKKLWATSALRVGKFFPQHWASSSQLQDKDKKIGVEPVGGLSPSDGVGSLPEGRPSSEEINPTIGKQKTDHDVAGGQGRPREGLIRKQIPWVRDESRDDWRARIRAMGYDPDDRRYLFFSRGPGLPKDEEPAKPNEVDPNRPREWELPKFEGGHWKRIDLTGGDQA